MEILLVEDSLVDARLTMGMLSHGHFKHRVTLVRDGAEAMDFLCRRERFARAPRPDLILLDLEMPKMDGRQVLSEVKSDFELRDIPVVVLTASEAEDDKVRSELLLVESYLVKPVNTDRFLSLMRELKRFWHADMIVPPMD